MCGDATVVFANTAVSLAKEQVWVSDAGTVGVRSYLIHMDCCRTRSAANTAKINLNAPRAGWYFGVEVCLTRRENIISVGGSGWTYFWWVRAPSEMSYETRRSPQLEANYVSCGLTCSLMCGSHLNQHERERNRLEVLSQVAALESASHDAEHTLRPQWVCHCAQDVESQVGPNGREVLFAEHEPTGNRDGAQDIRVDVAFVVQYLQGSPGGD